MPSYEELFAIAERLQAAAEAGEEREIAEPVSALEEAAKSVGRAFSGSWQGYHSRVYYADFSVIPAGARFSQEWGLMRGYTSGTYSPGDWREYNDETVEEHIRNLAGNPNLDMARKEAGRAAEVFNSAKSEIVSILHMEIDERSDSFLSALKEEIEKLSYRSASDIAQHYAPRGQIMTRDTVILGQGMQIPPHMKILAQALEMQHAFATCGVAADLAKKAASHIQRRASRNKTSERVGTNVFIGHGHSRVWKDLKDFIQDRIRLPWDEFNRVPVAGVTNITRLSEMLDAAAIAFLIMTAEDEMADGAHQARMNVIHEAGLFQGRLGFSRAIVMLEEGCQPFSNIDGLGHIPFPRGNIAAAFEEVRRVLEREGLSHVVT